MKRIISPEIERVVKQPTLSLEEEGKIFIIENGKTIKVFPGFVPTACYQRFPCEQGRSGKLKRKLVRPNKPTKQGWSDGLPEVRLVDSTQRQGKPVTRGSDKRDLDHSSET